MEIVSVIMNIRKIRRRSKTAGDCVYTQYTMNGSIETVVVELPRRTVFTRHDEVNNITSTCRACADVGCFYTSQSASSSVDPTTVIPT